MDITFDASMLDHLVIPKYKGLLWDRTPVLALYGGAGSGKSHFCAQKILLRILIGMSTGVKHKFLVLRKTQPSLRRSVFPLFRSYLSAWGMLGKIVFENKTELTFTFINGSAIVMTGMDDAEKLKSIEGITGVWMEETPEFSFSDWMQVQLRVRGNLPSYKQFLLSFNPVDEFHWLKTKLYDRREGLDEIKFIHSTYRDNPYMTSHDKQVLESLQDDDQNFYRIYALGEWGRLENIIYSKTDIVPKFPLVVEDEYYGIDFGYNNPSAVLRCGIKDDELYEEELLYETKLTNTDLVKRMEEVGVQKDKYVFCDAAEPDRIQEIQQAGWTLACAADKNVKQGIDLCKRKRINIIDGSDNLVAENRIYSYKVDKRTGQVYDEPVKYKDHLMDARRYAHYTYYKMFRECDTQIFGGSAPAISSNEVMETEYI